MSHIVLQHSAKFHHLYICNLFLHSTSFFLCLKLCPILTCLYSSVVAFVYCKQFTNATLLLLNFISLYLPTFSTLKYPLICFTLSPLVLVFHLNIPLMVNTLVLKELISQLTVPVVFLHLLCKLP